jgi:signal transduction histidine kinase
LAQADQELFEWQFVDVLVLTDYPSIVLELDRVRTELLPAYRPWVGKIHTFQTIEDISEQITCRCEKQRWPVVMLACSQTSPAKVTQYCQTLGRLDEHIMLVLLDYGDVMSCTESVTNHVVNPQRLLELPLPDNARHWQQMIMSMAKSQLALNQHRRTHLRTEQEEYETQLIEQLAQANVNAACMMADLEEARDKAMAADQAKGRFMANMTHELRTPLSAIMGYADLMRDDVQLSDEHREFTHGIYENGMNLLGILDDILHLTLIETEAFKPKPVPCDPMYLLQTIYANKIDQARHKGLAFVIEQSDISTQSRLVLLDDNRVRLILEKLVGNAIKFTGEGQIKLSFRVVQVKHGRNLCWRVSDTGIGIETDQLEAIFGDYYQADNSSTRQYGGVGLGLSICRRIARRLGGEIHVISQVGQGSSFELTVPCILPKSDDCQLQAI